MATRLLNVDEFNYNILDKFKEIFLQAREFIMKLIADAFAERFAHWNISLPKEDLNTRHSGYIHQAGWLIQYCFDKDENGEYMDYYAAHRMTSDSHIRIYDDGIKKSLPSMNDIYKTSKDPVEAKRLKDEYEQYNSKVVKILKDKGFTKFTTNMYLQARRDK